jgi:hypothetical protein
MAHDCELRSPITVYCLAKNTFSFLGVISFYFILFYHARTKEKLRCKHFATVLKRAGAGTLSIWRPKNYVPQVTLVSGSPIFASVGENYWFTFKLDDCYRNIELAELVYRPLGRYSSFEDSDHGVYFSLALVYSRTQATAIWSSGYSRRSIRFIRLQVKYIKQNAKGKKKIWEE